ncbi:hypothetical protein [Dechloromonas agitata]|uniref:hypothetical protein n=1 Tax=Dechloromonas agitata TaxID=73030 RepID=UPI0004870334|nr:hypothetical protein [Dechloromonas agitata]
MTLDELIARYQPMPEMRIIRFIASTELEADELYCEDLSVAGTYLIAVPKHLDDTTAASCAIGAFHSRIPIKYLHAFEYEMFDAESDTELFDDCELDCYELAKQAGAVICLTRCFAIEVESALVPS